MSTIFISGCWISFRLHAEAIRTAGLGSVGITPLLLPHFTIVLLLDICGDCTSSSAPLNSNSPDYSRRVMERATHGFYLGCCQITHHLLRGTK